MLVLIGGESFFRTAAEDTFHPLCGRWRVGNLTYPSLRVVTGDPSTGVLVFPCEPSDRVMAGLGPNPVLREGWTSDLDRRQYVDHG